jgi:hypothetical protein
MSMKNSNDTIGNRFRDLPVCSAVPQLTAPPAVCPCITLVIIQFHYKDTFHIFVSVLRRHVSFHPEDGKSNFPETKDYRKS